MALQAQQAQRDAINAWNRLVDDMFTSCMMSKGWRLVSPKEADAILASRTSLMSASDEPAQDAVGDP